MSASPAGGPPGPAPVARVRAPVSIFTKKKPPVRKALPGQTLPLPAKPAAPKPPIQQTPNGLHRPQNGAPAAPIPGVHPPRNFTISIHKTADHQDLRYHVMKFHSKATPTGQPASVNPYDHQQFEQPLTLHRRFAQDKPQTAEPSDGEKGEDDKMADMMSAKHAERVAEREANQKLIAPSGGEATKPMVRQKKHMKKVEEGRDETNPERVKRSKLRYEETRPWHLEDAESKSVWIGSHEKPLSEQSVMLAINAENGFDMIPVEKWYKFTPTGRVSTLDSDEVERQFNQKFNMPRWALGTQLAAEQTRQAERQRAQQASMVRKREMAEDEDRPKREDTGDYQADRDEMDLDYNDLNDFQDDDEGPLYLDAEGEDAKEIERRIREEMRGAALGGTGFKNEDIDPEEEYRREQAARREEEQKMKEMKKRLLKREHKQEYGLDYDDDDDWHDKYVSSSESEDSTDDEDKEKQDEEERKKEEARKAALASGTKSGTSSVGNSTPNGRVEKRDPTRLTASIGSKRPGSPDISDASGNESSRKKAKGANGLAVSSNGPKGARSLSPADAARRPAASGSASDTDTSRPTGGIVRPKIRIKSNSKGGPTSPNHSRAASPSAPPSRTGTPKPGSAAAANKLPFPTLEEVKAAIPPGGIAIKDLVALFKGKVGPRTGEFIALVKAAGQVDRGIAGRIMPK